MKRKKAFFILEQIFVIITLDYIFLIGDEFIYKTQWLPSFAIAILFFHLGTFISLYATITSTELTKEAKQLTHDFNFFIYLSFIGLLCFHNCLVNSGNLILNYCLGTYLLMNSVIFLFETHTSYKKYNASLIINN